MPTHWKKLTNPDYLGAYAFEPGEEKIGTIAAVREEGVVGMDGRTLEACARFGAVYLQAVGGAAAVTAHAIKRVPNVYFLEEFGAAEACWEFEVEDFRCVVAMDSHGTSLFAQVEADSRRRFESLICDKKQ